MVWSLARVLSTSRSLPTGARVNNSTGLDIGALTGEVST